jgi:soj protein
MISMKTISLINKKGGVGKTTIAINLAYLFAESCDLKVLVVDNDDQGNDTQFFEGDAEINLADILMGDRSLKEVVQKTRYERIDLIASDTDLLDANIAVIKDENIVQQNILRNALRDVETEYDICIIDNPPTINASVINALVASDDVIIVTTPDIYGIRGVDRMVDYINSFKRYNPDLRFCGVLLNKFASTPHGYRCIDMLRSRVPLFTSRIRYTKDKLEAATEERKTIYEYSPSCGFARDLGNFLEEYLKGWAN